VSNVLSGVSLRYFTSANHGTLSGMRLWLLMNSGSSSLGNRIKVAESVLSLSRRIGLKTAEQVFHSLQNS
jgi:hypothetical protein